MHASKCLKTFLFLISTVVIFSAVAGTNQHPSRQWMHPFQNRLPNTFTDKQIQNKLRAAAAIKQRLDSINTFTLDSLGIPSLIEGIIKFEYNEYGQLKAQIMNSWDYESTTRTWSECVVYTYDSKGFMSVDSSFSWDDETKKWILGGVTNYTYDAMGRLTLLIESYLGSYSTSVFKTTYQFDDYGTLLNETEYYLDRFNQWVFESKSDYSYLANGLLATQVDSSWDYENKSWFFSQKTETLYDEKGKDTLTTTYGWNGTSQTWINLKKVEHSYDSDGNMTKEINYEFSDDTNQWNALYKGQFLFDAQGNMTREDHFVWDSDSLNWYGYTSSTFDFDLTVDNKDVIMPFGLSNFAFNNKLTGGTVNFWINETHSWIPVVKATCFYSDMDVMRLPVSKKGNQAWMYEPSTKTLILDHIPFTANVQVFDMQGRRVISQIASKSLSLNGLSKGLYVIRVESTLGVERGKLMVE